jgi:acyl transferase domain-containing protein/acyl carrier protein
MTTDKEHEPIAIVGIGCRFPGGASSPDKLWNLLVDGVDAIVPVPSDRWDSRRFYDDNHDKAGKTYMKEGGFLQEDIFEFDPLFFGISPREAEKLDPQQRLLLEVTWEAFEDAGLTDSKFRGSKTGVFIGGFNLDNLVNRSGMTECDIVDTHTAVSSSMTILANRLSYTFDLRGPSLTIDTACSSSLVSTHYACLSIWSGESDMAVAGGVNVMLSPFYPIAMSKGQFLSPLGRSMAFDERAAGYGRGEGAGIVILKSLSAAQRDNDNIYSLIKMTGSNQDGHTMGISVPSGDAQQTLIKDVYKKAGIKPSDIQYIEAHGTGTQAGDPVEANALHAVVKEGRVLNDKCLVGSVKTNIGHLEAAAGIAGLIKASLSLKNNKIPASLHFNKPNPAIPFDEMNIKVNTALQDWPNNNVVRYAGVNSFGYGGSNAHVLLEEAPEKTPLKSTKNPSQFQLIPLSAKSDAALADLAAKNAYFLSANREADSLDNLIYTLSQRRSHHSHRMVLLAQHSEDVHKNLQLFSMGRQVEDVVTGQADLSEDRKVVFVYTGMGPQWFGMGKELMETEAVFNEAIHRCDAAFQTISGWSILDAMMAGDFGENIAKTEIAQPANFILQIALTELWVSWGIKADAVIGHSVGEVSAAYVSGALSLEDAVNVCYQRSRLQAKTANQNGGMLAVGLSKQDAQALIADYDNVEIAAVNSPNSVTLSGNKPQLQSLAETLDTTFNRFLAVDIAYHSNNMDMIKDEVLSNLKALKPTETTIDLYSTVSGERISGLDLDAEYWWSNVRQTVNFNEGISSLINDGFTSFVEVGPHPVLAHSIKEIGLETQADLEQFHTFYRGKEEAKTIYSSLATLYTKGFSLNWSELTAGGQLVSIPSYPWQKNRYWKETESSRQERFGQPGHILLNNKIPAAEPTWTVELNSSLLPFINEHKVFGETVYPGTGYYEAAFALHKEFFKQKEFVLVDVKIHKMLFVEEGRNQYLASKYSPEDNKFYLYKYFSDDEYQWDLICEGRLDSSGVLKQKNNINLDALKSKINTEYSAEDLYSAITERGLIYGKSFRSIKQYWMADKEALLRVEMDPITAGDHNQYHFHPGLLDAAGHAALALVPGDYPFVPVTTESFTFYGQVDIHACWFHVTVSNVTKRSFDVNYVIYDDDGHVVADVKNVECRLLRSLPVKEEIKLTNYVYGHNWYEYTEKLESELNVDKVLLFTGQDPYLLEFEAELTNKNIAFTQVYQGSQYQQPATSYQVNAGDKASYKALFNDININEFSHIIFAWPLQTYQHGPDFDTTSDDSLALVNLAQTLNELDAQKVNLTIVTRGSQSVLNDEVIENVNHNALWGLGLLITNENPKVNVRLIDLDSVDNKSKQLDQYHYILNADALELAFRSDTVYVQKLDKIDDYNDKIKQFFLDLKTKLSSVSANDDNFSADGTYIVVGGTKGVGIEITRWLASKGIGKLILLSRSGLDDDGTKNILSEFDDDAVSVELHKLDISKEQEVDKLFDYIHESCPPVMGVVHAAAVYDDDYIQNMNKVRFDRVLSPKVAGVLNLYKHVRNIDLKFLLLMSSFASVASIRRQANYIAANRFFDSFANYASAHSTPTIAINFGPIGGAGQVSRDEVLDEYMSNTGLFTIPVNEVIQFMEIMIGETVSNIGLFNMDWELWADVYDQAGNSSRFIGLTDRDNSSTENSKSIKNITALSSLEHSEKEKFIENILFDNLADLMKLQKGELHSKHRLNDLGVDSLMSLDFVLTIKSELGFEISASDLARNPSLEELTSTIGATLIN